MEENNKLEIQLNDVKALERLFREDFMDITRIIGMFD